MAVTAAAPSLVDEFPDEILIPILRGVDVKDLPAVLSTCRDFYRLRVEYKPQLLIEALGWDAEACLWAGTENNDMDLVHYVLKRGADIEARRKRGTPLLNRGAAIEVRDDYDKTPLHYAAYLGHEAIVKLLLDRGADIEARDEDGQTPLHYAAHLSHEAIVKLLLDRGAATEARDGYYGQTPLYFAVGRGSSEDIVKLLLDRGAYVDARDICDQTPLNLAVKMGNRGAIAIVIVKLLIDRGAAIESRDCYGMAPQHHAAYLGNEAIVKLLLDRGAEIDGARDRR
jgi:ankyrin repeat protein